MREPSSFDPDSPRPYWVPEGVDFQSLPEGVQTAIAGIVQPAYEQLVLQARDGLEKSTGVTIVHLLWLEILDQIDLEQQRTVAREDVDLRALRDKSIDRTLRLIGAENKMSGLLLRVQQLQQRDDFADDWQPIASSPGSPR